ncbi:MAG TPA: DJ-1/PfpI family protein [Thermoanaerobaculia bacterium]|nr:DJ-1/PfpI family protein [Thermoanaerobaculia bacterium]
MAMRVGFPLYQGCTLLDFAGATQVFAFAGFTPVWLAATGDPIRTTEDVQVVPGGTFDDPGGKIDLLFVPGGGDAVAKVMHDPVLVGFVRKTGSAASWAGSVCTGAFILAAAGLLDGYEATTYWSQRENLALFPKIKVAAGYPRWVIHGNRFSGGGISSSLDLALELVNLISGPTASMTTQLSSQYAPSPPYASGDPAQAPPEVTDAVRKDQKKFIAKMRKSVEKLVEK